MSAFPPRGKRRRPRRKGKADGKPPVKPTQVFNLTVEGQEMRLRYTPNWWPGKYPYGHFEFLSPHEPRRRIPVSVTGYLSHFAPMAEIEAAPSPLDYAREVVLTLLREREGRPAKAEDGRQLRLFA